MSPAGHPRGAVVIPAHDEAAVVERCLRALYEGVEPGEIQVVVACNGCSDRTAEVARRSGLPVDVLEIETPSKTAALRAADDVMAVFPRLYLDADVVLPGASAVRVLDRLREGPVVAARPPLRYDSSGSTALVRRYFRARAQVPALMGNLWGAGVYGLSEAGRARFGSWPDVVADDLFVDRLFEADEIEIVDCEPVVVAVPRTSRDLVNVLRRSYRGPAALDASDVDVPRKATLPGTRDDLLRLARRGPVQLLDASVYAGFAVAGRLARARAGDTWERDDSSRSPV